MRTKDVPKKKKKDKKKVEIECERSVQHQHAFQFKMLTSSMSTIHTFAAADALGPDLFYNTPSESNPFSEKCIHHELSLLS